MQVFVARKYFSLMYRVWIHAQCAQVETMEAQSSDVGELRGQVRHHWMQSIGENMFLRLLCSCVFQALLSTLTCLKFPDEHHSWLLLHRLGDLRQHWQLPMQR
jgi:hypothetical protein